MVGSRTKRTLRAAQTRFPFLLDTKFRLQRAWRQFRRQPFEPEFEILRHLAIGPGQVAVDVGANRGQSIDAIRLFRPDLPIVAFEANPDLAQALASMFADDGGVSVRAKALGAETATLTLHIPYYRGWMFDGLASLDRTSAEEWLTPERMPGFDPAHLRIEEVTCPVERLDDQRLDPVFMKIDVQGAEPLVLEGGRATLERARPVLVIEHDGAPPALLAELGYLEFALQGDHLGPVTSAATRHRNSLHLMPEHLTRLTEVAPGLTARLDDTVLEAIG